MQDHPGVSYQLFSSTTNYCNRTLLVSITPKRLFSHNVLVQMGKNLFILALEWSFSLTKTIRARVCERTLVRLVWLCASQAHFGACWKYIPSSIPRQTTYLRPASLMCSTVPLCIGGVEFWEIFRSSWDDLLVNTVPWSHHTPYVEFFFTSSCWIYNIGCVLVTTQPSEQSAETMLSLFFDRAVFSSDRIMTCLSTLFISFGNFITSVQYYANVARG